MLHIGYIIVHFQSLIKRSHKLIPNHPNVTCPMSMSQQALPCTHPPGTAERGFIFFV